MSVTRSGVKTYEFHDGGGRLLVELTPAQGNRLTEHFYLGQQRVAQRVSEPPSLTVAKTGAGFGTVASAPAGISCGAVCSASFAGGTPITLTATPDAGSAFAGWSGACTGTGIFQVSLAVSTGVTAQFNALARSIVAGDFTGDGRGDLARLNAAGHVFYSANLNGWAVIPGPEPSDRDGPQRQRPYFHNDIAGTPMATTDAAGNLNGCSTRPAPPTTGRGMGASRKTRTPG